MIWQERPPDTNTVIGHQIVAIHPGALAMAVDRLVSTGSAVKHLKVRSGEHIAALLLTAILGKPTGVDVSGQVDLQFSRASSSDYTDYWPFGNNDTAAFEIKSLAGGFRHAESRMGIGEGHTVMVRFAFEILSDAAVQLIAACDALARKCDSTTSKNVFLIIHPFDAVAAELFEEPGVILGHLLPLLSPKIQIHTLWILWHPDILVMWSQAEREWTDVLFDTAPETAESVPDRGLTYLQRAEDDFLDAIGHTKGSPWLFGFSVS